MSPSHMLCPNCSNPMTRGAASIGEDLSDALLAGASFSRLFLELPGGKQETILSTGERRDAWFCRPCFVTVVTRADNIMEHWAPATPAPEHTAEPMTCLSCGAGMPTGKDVCPACGWSWKQ